MFNDDFLDLLTVMSFIVGLMNYDENLTQNDKQELMTEVDKKTENVLAKIEQHLVKQDEKINLILEKLGVENE